MYIKKYSNLPKELFGLLFWNIFFAYLVVFIIVGLLAFFDIQPMKFNDKPTTGVLGLVVSLMLSPFISLVTTIGTWILLKFGNLIMRIFTKNQGAS